MKKMFLILTIVLIATPAWAGIIIEAAPSYECNEITITYDVDDSDANLPRAFALEVSLTQENDANIIEVTYVHPEFHVYPGSIVITGGVVTDQGTPVAWSDVNNMIVEMGSLWAPEDPCHTTAPDPEGILLKFTVTADCHVDLEQNAIRGGVVIEDTTIAPGPSYVTLIECDMSNVTLCCKGDVTGDTAVSIADLSAIVAALSPAYAGTTPPYTACPPPAGVEAGDVTGDSCLSIADLSAVVAYLSPAYASTTPPFTGPCMP
ncbi:MAG: hypothetical protein ACYS1A_06735 [Planctomycetota bacterium]|jgi:hypothetical protein